MFNFRKKSELNMLRTIIIDDEPHVRKTLARMIKEECSNVKLLKSANGVKSGLKAIEEQNPDLVLLDIKMDDGTGFDLLKKAEPINFKVIFITAFDQYAIQAFKFSAIDYLLKPVDPEDLVRAVNRAEQMMQQDFSTQLKALDENLKTQEPKGKKIILRTSETVYLVKVSDISYCESDLSYTQFYLADGQKILVSKTLREFDDMLKEFGFFRVHKSFLVNLLAITKFEKADGGYLVMENKDRVPVASRKRDQLLELFDRITGN
jgi:two-component system LytT family response regulator